MPVTFSLVVQGGGGDGDSDDDGMDDDDSLSDWNLRMSAFTVLLKCLKYGFCS